MKYNPEIDHRHSIRLRNYDYSSVGIYFITICTHNKEELFGEIQMGEMCLNESGNIVNKLIINLHVKYNNIVIDNYVIMPNHIHMIIIITDSNQSVGAIHELPKIELPQIEIQQNVLSKQEFSVDKFSHNDLSQDRQIQKRIQRRNMLIPKIIGFLKMNSSKQINHKCKTTGEPVWQRNYYEHIIRNDKEYYNTVKYIIDNPLNWGNDDENKNRKDNL